MIVYCFEKSLGVLIQRNACERGAPEPPHKHDFIELVYNREGHGVHEVNGVPYPVRRGDLLFINYGETHAIHTDGTLRYYNFLVKPEFISENIVNSETIDDVFLLFLPDNEQLPTNRVPLVHFSGDEQAEIESMAERMVRESEEKQVGYQSVLNGYMRLLFARLMRAMLRGAGENRPKLLTAEILSYLDKNYAEPLTVNFLSDQFFYNPAYLGRAFKAVYGVSIKEYLTEKRLERAAALLSDKSVPRSVEDIAASVGYTSRAQFYRAFREKYGTTPGEYCKQK